MDPTYTYSVPVKQMVSGGFDTLSHIMETYFSEPDEDNVSDDISEALMRNVIRNLRAAIKNPRDYTARSNLLWDSTMAAVWQFFTRFIIAISIGKDFRNLSALPRMYGSLTEMA